jgi:hypothetical protein
MAEFISSSRKSLRVPLRCVAWIELGELACEGHTEDLGARGCRLVLPTRLDPGTVVRVMLWHDLGARVLGLSATVIWTSTEAPWRHGLAYATVDRGAAEEWFERVLSGHPELLLEDPVPDRVALTCRVHPTGRAASPAPLGVEEETVLRLAAGRPSVAELQDRLGADWTRAQRALFSLLMRGDLAIDAGPPAVAPAAAADAPRRLTRA